MNQQIDVLAEAIAQTWGGEEVGPMEKSEATDLVQFLNDHGWQITRKDVVDIDGSASALQRALDGGDV